jgi:hypothetical protein
VGAAGEAVVAGADPAVVVAAEAGGGAGGNPGWATEAAGR